MTASPILENYKFPVFMKAPIWSQTPVTPAQVNAGDILAVVDYPYF